MKAYFRSRRDIWKVPVAHHQCAAIIPGAWSIPGIPYGTLDSASGSATIMERAVRAEDVPPVPAH